MHISRVKNIKATEYINNKEITEVKIEEGVEFIGTSAFCGCSHLKNIEFPYTLKVIGNWAFEDCAEINELSLPYNLIEIGYESLITEKKKYI